MKHELFAALSLALTLNLALGLLLMSRNLPHRRFHRSSRPGCDFYVGIESVAQPAKAPGPATAGIGRGLAAGDRSPVTGISEEAHYVLVVALRPLHPVLVLGLFGQQLLTLHLGLYLGRDIGDDELHDASDDEHHVLQWDKDCRKF